MMKDAYQKGWRNDAVIMPTSDNEQFKTHGYDSGTDGIIKMTMIFNPGLNREDFFRTMYRMLDECPDDLEAFRKLYLENDSYALNKNDIIPMRVEK